MLLNLSYIILKLLDTRHHRRALRARYLVFIFYSFYYFF